MKLNIIEIKNFRSIKSLEIHTNPNCQVFVGLNESGKSNILRAISLLSDKTELQKSDVRTHYEGEDTNESFVKFFFTMDDDDLIKPIETFFKGICLESDIEKITYRKQDTPLRNLLLSLNQFVYIRNVKTGSKSVFQYIPEEYYKIEVPQLLKPKDINSSITLVDGKTIVASSFKFYSKALISLNNLNLFDTCQLGDLIKIFEGVCEKRFVSQMPAVIYWEYKDDLILPDSISLDGFIGNPNSNQPLKTMFKLAGIKDIKKTLQDAKTAGSASLRSLMSKVSKESTSYIRNAWKSCEDISFELESSESVINIYVRGSRAYYNCLQRSEGFKRFVAFIISLAAKVKQGEIVNSVIILDEPENGIHINGQRDLVEELVKVSEKNLVFYSIHSIFMIDRNLPERHFEVKKEDEATTVTQVKESDHSDDEVINNALGYSFFEVINKKNVLFEGFYDKKLFEVAKTSKKLKTTGFTKTGHVFGAGASDMSKLAKMLELANRDYIVMSDNDKRALQEKKEYEEIHKCAGEWYTYNDCIARAVTSEDFVEHSKIEDAIKIICEPELMKNFDSNHFQTKENDRLIHVKEWLGKNGKDVKKTAREVKSAIYSDLVPEDIEDRYDTVLEKIRNAF